MHKIGYTDSRGAFVPLYDLPDTLSELPAEYFPYFCDLVQQIQSSALTVETAATHLAIRMTGADHLRTYNTRACDNIALVASELIALFRDTLSHQHNPMPRIVLSDGLSVRALGFGLTDATAREFLHLYTQLRRYIESPSEQRMDYLLSSLYPSSDPDIQSQVEGYMHTLAAPARQHLYAHIAASYSYLTSGVIRLYSITTTFRELFYAPATDTDSTPSEHPKDFADVLVSIAESGAFGPLDKVYDTNIVVLLRYMQTKHEEAERLKKKYKNVKKH